APAGAGPVLALVALATLGTLGPFALFAFGQSRTSPAMAGAFLNLEPLVGAAAGALAFGDPFGGGQLAGALAILLGIGLSTKPAARNVVRGAGATGGGEAAQAAAGGPPAAAGA